MGRVVRNLVVKTDFYGSGYTKNFYDVALEDVELYETKKSYGDKYWYIKVRGVEYELCPPPTADWQHNPTAERLCKKAVDLLADIKRQLDNAVDSPSELVVERTTDPAKASQS